MTARIAWQAGLTIATALVVMTSSARPGLATLAAQAPRPAGAPAVRRDPSPAAPVAATTITAEGGRIDWLPRGERLAFDRRGADGYFDIYTMTTLGSDVRCLTCDKTELPNKSIGNPAWHPSGNYIAFVAQNSYAGLGTITDYFANPGAGVNNDLWIMDKDGRQFWPLTQVKPREGGVLHPHFSRNGDKLIWSERMSSAGGPWGTWAIRLADFTLTGGTPAISNIQTLQPGVQHRMYETHGFTPDGRQILFSGNLQEGQDEESADIYLYNLQTGALTNLTDSMDEWDEHAQFSPDGRFIIWMTNKGQPSIPLGGLRTDYWLMDANGTNKRRLTYFNERGHAEYMQGGVIAADATWSPDGRRIASYVITDVRQGGVNVMLSFP